MTEAKRAIEAIKAGEITAKQLEDMSGVGDDWENGVRRYYFGDGSVVVEDAWGLEVEGQEWEWCQ